MKSLEGLTNVGEADTMYTERHRSKLHTSDCTVYGQCELSDVTVESMIAAEKAAAEQAAAEKAAAETVVVETVVTSPKTVDAAVIAAIAAIVSGAGYMAAKKH